VKKVYFFSYSVPIFNNRHLELAAASNQW